MEGLEEELEGEFPMAEKGSRGVNLTGHKCNKCKASKLDQCIVRDRNEAMVSGDVRSNKRDMTPRLPGWLITRCNKKHNCLIKESSTSMPGGNQVDGLPPAHNLCSFIIKWF